MYDVRNKIAYNETRTFKLRLYLMLITLDKHYQRQKEIACNELFLIRVEKRGMT